MRYGMGKEKARAARMVKEREQKDSKVERKEKEKDFKENVINVGNWVTHNGNAKAKEKEKVEHTTSKSGTTIRVGGRTTTTHGATKTVVTTTNKEEQMADPQPTSNRGQCG